MRWVNDCMYVCMYVDYADAKKLEPKFYQELKEKGLALQYPFELDEFQQQAVGVLTYIFFCMYVLMYVCMCHSEGASSGER